ncbi:MAG: hypothetical protein JW953_01445 [Anaerolineae bacterium]|nr:hypothetical protein [Anaerolineae bacterium]
MSQNYYQQKYNSWSFAAGGCLGFILSACLWCPLLALVIQTTTPPSTPSQSSRAPVIDRPVIPVSTPTPLPLSSPPPTGPPIAGPPPTATPAPQPIIFNGAGDLIQELNKWPGPAIVHLTGNAGQRHFAVVTYNANGDTLDLLVNTADAYDGRTLIDYTGEHTTRLEIDAEGDWTIEILPLTAATLLPVPGSIEGNGDDVLLLSGGVPDTAVVTGNASTRHFALTVFGQGRMLDVPINTADPYDGQVLVNRQAQLLKFSAHGPWAISIVAAP